MSKTEKPFDFVKINLASPTRIRSWSERVLPNGESIGEVTTPETLNYRTLKPEMEGLFCERIFGPINNWRCRCGKYKGVSSQGIVCERCGVEVSDSNVRRHRTGFVELGCPVTHVWYVKSRPSKIARILDISLKDLENIVYFNSYVVIDPGKSSMFQCKKVLKEYNWQAFELYGKLYGNSINDVNILIGAEAIKTLLKNLKLKKLSSRLRRKLNEENPKNRDEYLIMKFPGIKEQDRKKLRIRIRLIEQFLSSGADPVWMVLDIIPVLPPDLRPMVKLDGGRFATADLNDLYRRVINRNNRLERLRAMQSPELLVRNEKRMLQEAVDALIDNGKRGRAFCGLNNRPLKSLSDIIEGKQGRFRQNLLGKRVDYSGRSVIIVGPELRLAQCGLPREMAMELFHPFVIHRLIYKKLATNMIAAKKIIKQNKTFAWDSLKEVMTGHPVLLNRAPTLHRLGIQAFEPILVEGRAIKLHPLVCAAFNADFDGDQMAVHIPLCLEAQVEARFLMLAPNNFLSPATGEPILTPSQDMILGSYYLTANNPTEQFGESQYFYNFEDVITAYKQAVIKLHTFVWVRIEEQDEINFSSDCEFIQEKINNRIFNLTPHSIIKKDLDGNTLQIYLKTTPGRIILNRSLDSKE